MGVAESCTAESWEESEWDRERHGARSCSAGCEKRFGTLESAVLSGNGPLERPQPARLSRTTDGRGDGGSSRALPPLAAANKCPSHTPVRQVRQVRQVRPHALPRNHRATGPTVADVRWSESRPILPYGRNRKATKSRGRAPILSSDVPLSDTAADPREIHHP
jgi:hypothetical protein